MNAQNLINNAIQNWLDAHPTLSWIVDHPIWTLVLGLLVLFLLWGLLNAIARFTEQFWMVLLRLPVRLSQWLFRGSPKVLMGLLPFQPKEDPKKQLQEVLDRLEELRKEEDQLLEQVKKLLASQN